MKSTSVLDLKESYELFENQTKDIVRTASRNEVNQIRRIYIEFIPGESLAGTIRSLFSIRQGIKMER